VKIASEKEKTFPLPLPNENAKWEKVQKPAGFALHLHFAREIFLPICLIEMRSHFHGQNLNRHSALLENRAGKVGVTKVKARERGSEKLPEIMA